MARFQSFIDDSRRTLRSLSRNPGFALSAILTLSLAIGANTAIFSLLYVVLLRPLPVESPGDLVEMLHLYPLSGEPKINGFPMEICEHIRENSQTLSGLIVMASPGFDGFSVRREGAEPERMRGQYVDGGYFQMLGLQPAMGRLLRRDDDAAGGGAGHAAGVLSWDCWRNRFQADPNIVGAQVLVERLPVTVIGVAPRGFDGLQIGNANEIWLPLSTYPLIHSRQTGGAMVGRLRAGITLDDAEAELEHLYRQAWDPAALARDPNLRRMRFFVESATNGIGMVKDRFRMPLLLLMAAVGLLLLLACTNLASILIARGKARQRDLAIRAALGSGPIGLLWHTALECTALTLAGGAGGLLLARLGANALARIIGSSRPHERVELAVPLDSTVLLFATCTVALALFLFGLMPALRAMRTAPAVLLREGGRAGVSLREQRLGRSLIVFQLIMSVVLLTTAVLFARQLFALRNHELGFEPDGVVIVSLDPSQTRLEHPREAQSYQELIGRLGTIPGIESVTLSGATPISGAAASRFATTEGFVEGDDRRRRVSVNWVAPAYFRTYRTPLLAGREFEFRDQGGEPLAIVNRALADHYFRDQDPIGRHLQLERQETPVRIVGVVADARYTDLHTESPRTCYLFEFQREGDFGRQLSLRSDLPQDLLLGEIRGVVRETVPGLRIAKATTLRAQMDASLVPERLLDLLSRLFGLLGIVITGVGLYGILQHRVVSRTKEIGIRMAVGATREHIGGMILWEALRLLGIGLLVGVPASWWAERFVESRFEGVAADGPLTLLIATVVVALTTAVAAAIPVARAARLNPVDSLRAE